MIFAMCAYFVSGSALVTPPMRIGRALAFWSSFFVVMLVFAPLGVRR